MGQFLGEFEQMVLLAVMRLDEAAYGMSIRAEIEQRTDRDVSIGAVYTTLERMERKGYVASTVGEPTRSRGGRRKKTYRLQPAGRRALNHTWQAFRSMASGLEPQLESQP